MSIKTADPLLAIGQAIVIIGQWLMGLCAVFVLVAIPVIAFVKDALIVQIRAEQGDPAMVVPIMTLLGAGLVGLAILALMFLFFRNLRRIIATVGAGDPFVPINADRLTGMAWLILAVQGLTVALALLGYHLASALGQDEAGFESMDVDLSGIVLVVTLFILARVFRQGAAMRDDLEGTI